MMVVGRTIPSTGAQSLANMIIGFVTRVVFPGYSAPAGQEAALFVHFLSVAVELPALSSSGP
jgi:hypothetical protein